MSIDLRNSIRNKLFLMIGCLLNIIQMRFVEKDVGFVLLIIASSLLLFYMKNRVINLVVLLGIFFLVINFPKVVLFFPVLLYDWVDEERPYTYLFFTALGSLLLLISDINNMTIIISYFFLIATSLCLKNQSEKNSRLLQEFQQLDLSSKEQQFLLNRQNLNLIKEQNLNLNLGISEERNRIARDIHDNVGHLLSSSLIQIGALNVLNQDKNLEEPLALLKVTVQEGMDNIRESVHNLHDDSLNLEQSLVHIVDNFQDSPIALTYTITSQLSSSLKMDFLMIIRESLANVMKHAKCSKVILEVVEQPAFYRLRIKDNGTNCNELNKSPIEMGMGLASMKERINKQGGRLTVERLSDGFQVLAIVPKMKKGER